MSSSISTVYLDPEFEDMTPEKLLNLTSSTNNSLNQQQSQPRSLESANERNNKTYLTPREYQYELYTKAIDQNIIAVLDTGAGKTLISVMLMKYMLAIENEKCQTDANYKKKVTFFLVDRVPLVFQQTNVIEANMDARIEKMCGEMNVDAWSRIKWREKIDNHDICVMTAQVLLDILQRGFLSLDEVNLIIFDECHHAVKGHPFNRIMYPFYHHLPVAHKPKVFGMTASPIFSHKDIYKGINILEANLDCQVYTAIQSQNELLKAVQKPTESVIYYSMKVIDDLPQQVHNGNNSKEYYVERQRLINVELRYSRTLLTTAISSKIETVNGYREILTIADYVSNNLGPWCCDRLWKILLEGAHHYGHFEAPTPYVDPRKLSSTELQLVKEAYALCCSTPIDAITDPNLNNAALFTPKAKALMECLKGAISTKRDEDFRCIIFVERRHTAAAIKLLIDSLTTFKGFIHCDILIGHGVSSNHRGNVSMNYHDQNSIIGKFRKGELNLMIATNVAEEGLDIQACNYVIRFDMFKTLPAYIQSRGRARRPNSEYILLINSQNIKENGLLKKFKQVEIQMKEFCRMLSADRNVARYYHDNEGFYQDDPDEAALSVPSHCEDANAIRAITAAKHLKDAYPIQSTGALLTLASSVSLIYHYCDSLPADDFCQFRPIYKMTEVSKQVPHPVMMYYCTLTLPINSTLRTFEGCCVYSKNDAKMGVSLKACIALHQAGLIDDNLVPMTKKKKEELKKQLEQQRDEKGLQIGSRSRENTYEKAIPSFWSTSSKDGDHDEDKTGREDFVKGDEEVTAATKEETLPIGPYWVSYIEVSKTTISPPFRKMCLITRKPLPDIPDIHLYPINKEQPLVAHINNPVKSEIRFEKPKRLDLLVDYLFALTRCITNKEFTCPRKDVPYLLAPLRKDNSIDWKEIKRSIKNDNTTRLDMFDDDELEDCIVIDHSDPRQRRYFINQVNHTGMTLQSKVPDSVPKLRESGYATFADYYQAQEGDMKEITDKNQTLFNVTGILKSNIYSLTPKEGPTKQPSESIVSWLPPEVCRLYCISASVYQTCQMIPWIMSRMDATLLVQDAKQTLQINWIPDQLMLEALTASSAAIHINYQRLEFLGDSVLKFIASTRVFTHNLLMNESDLTTERTFMISNSTLFHTANKLKLYHYITSQNLPLKRYWRPPFFRSETDSEEMKSKMMYHRLADKTLADVIESILGAAWLNHKNLDWVLNAAQRLGVPLKYVHVWSDFNKLYTGKKESAAKKTNKTVVDEFITTTSSHTFDPAHCSANVSRVSAMVGHTFQDPSLVAEALTHATVMNSSVGCYQRLEFLGDAVLDFCVVNYFFQKYPDAPPGHLHDLKKSSVNNHLLALLCVRFKLHSHILHFSDSLVGAIHYFLQELQDADSEKKEYWNDLHPPKVLSDIIESLFGAVYVDSGFDLMPCVELFERWLKPFLDEHVTLDLIEEHPSGKFMMLVQKQGCMQAMISKLPTTNGSATQQQKSIIFIHKTPITSGFGHNVDQAKMMASKRACQLIEKEPQLISRLCTCHDSELS